MSTSSLQTADLNNPSAAAAAPLAVIPDNMTVSEMMVLMLQYQSFHSFVHYPTSTTSTTSMNVHDVEADEKNTNTTTTKTIQQQQQQQLQQQKQVDNSEDPKAQGSRFKKRFTPPNKAIVDTMKNNNENGKRKRRGKLSDGDDERDNVVQRRRPSKRSKQPDNVLTPLDIASSEPWNLHAHAHASSDDDLNVHGVKPSVPTVVELIELDDHHHRWFQQQQQNLYGANPNDDLPLSPSELLLDGVVEESYGGDDDDGAEGDFRFRYNEFNGSGSIVFSDMHLTTGETTRASSPTVSSVDDFLIDASPFPAFDLSFDTESQTSTTSSDTTMAESAYTTTKSTQSATQSAAPKAIAKLQSIFDQQQKVFSAYCAIQTNQTLMLNRWNQ